MFQTNYSHKPQNCKIEFRNAFVFFEYLMLSHLIVEILSVFQKCMELKCIAMND